MKLINIIETCPFCKMTYVVYGIPAKGYTDWCRGTLIQKALPELCPTKRESLISGICPDCQDDLFGDPYDEVDDEDIFAEEDNEKE